MRSVNVGFTARSAALRAKKLAQLAHVSDSDSDDSASSLSSLSSDDDSSEDDDSSSSSSSSSSSDDVDDDSDGYSDSSDDDQDDDRSTVPTSDDEYNDGSAPSPKRRKRRATVGAANNTPTKRSKANILGDVSRAPTTLPDKLEVTKLGQFPVRARAKRLLHVGATPESLPCRQEQFDEVLACLEDAVQEGLGGCIYVSGVPGTGKTATVREVIRSLQRRADTGAVNKFNFCEINGMKLQDAQDTYSVLWHALTGLRCSNSVALRLLAQRFSGGGGSSSSSSSDHATTVVLMDELDQLMTARQDVMYNMFNWPSGARSRLVVVAVANTMDLPERVLHAKVASRLGMTRITFRPYNDRQLVEIVHARLGISSTSSDGRGAGAEQQSLSSNAAIGALPNTHGCDAVFAPEALVYLAKRVANVSGDARRMLDVCRRSIDAVEEARRHSGTAHATECISIGDMKRVIDAMVKSSKGAHIARLALHAKLALVAVVLSVRRAGKAEVDLGTITATHLSQARIHAIPLPDDGGNEDLGRLSSIANLVGKLCALGLVIAVGSGVASARSGRFARYILAVGEDDVRLALEQDDDSRLRSML